MNGIIASTTWDDCHECKHYGDDGCHEDIEIKYDPIQDAIICENY